MDISEFVKASLVQIIKGVADAILETQTNDNRSVINPTQKSAAHSDPTKVKFDIAVTVQEDTGVSGTGGIKIFGAQLGASGDKSLSNTAVSRLTFEVPVAWPSVAKTQYPQDGNSSKNEYNPFAV